MRIFPTPLAAGLVALTLHADALAQIALTPSLTLSGYGTAGVVRSDNERADYLVDAFKPNGPGRTREWSSDVDTHLGLQATYTISPQFTAVLQVLMQQRYDNAWRPVVEWANLKYQITPDISVRAGRIVLPIFMVTDSRRIGYANPWVRPPVEVYSMVPVTNNDGVDASHRMSIAGGTNTFQVTTGRSDSKFPASGGFGTGTAEARKLLAFVDTFEIGAFTARFGYGEADLTIAELSALFIPFRQFGAAGNAIADRYDVNDKRVDFLGVGLSYDPGPWFAIAEWARFDTHSIIGAKNAWYVSGGARFGKFTPYATYAKLKADSNTTDPGIPLTGLPPPVAAVAAQLNAALNATLAIIPRQSTASIGVRWDFMRNAALKLQLDRVKVEEGSRGTFGNAPPEVSTAGTTQLFSLAVDFVF